MGPPRRWVSTYALHESRCRQLDALLVSLLGMSRPPDLTSALRFEVLADIAQGETARVDLCGITEPEEKRGQLIAVKRLHRHIARDLAFRNMFFDEVWLTAALHHPNVVEVVGFGTDDDGTYLAVELVQGVSLARLMKTVFDTGEAFGERMVVFLGHQMCAGLKAAHELRGSNGEHLGLVHRGLAPGNVLVGFQGQIKIADFGLAKAKQRVTKTLTGLIKGNPQYMAPELTVGEGIDARADLFSLGVLLFELFTGSHPWPGSSEVETMHMILDKPPRDIRSLRPRLDRELASVVAKALSRDVDARFQTADELGQRLWKWLSAHGYKEGNAEALGRFVRRNAMRQMRWFERATTGELRPESHSPAPPTTAGEAPRGSTRSPANEPAHSRWRSKPELELAEPERSAEYELPTVVRRSDAALPGFELLDEESDNHPTAIQRPGEPLPLRRVEAGVAATDDRRDSRSSYPAVHRRISSPEVVAPGSAHDRAHQIFLLLQHTRGAEQRAHELARSWDELAKLAEEAARLAGEAQAALASGDTDNAERLCMQASGIAGEIQRGADRIYGGGARWLVAEANTPAPDSQDLRRGPVFAGAAAKMRLSGSEPPVSSRGPNRSASAAPLLTLVLFAFLVSLTFVIVVATC